MTWLAILALAIWVLIERERTSKLERELREALRRPGALPPATATTQVAQPGPPPGAITPVMESAARVAAERAAARTPPVSQAVTATASVTAAPSPRPQPAPVPPRRPTQTRAPLTRAAVERWLSEQGLAWIGGAALVIGGAFLVGYAAQRGFFTPQMRIVAGALLGSLLLAVGEWVRGGRLAGFGGHKLAAGVLSGAGAAVLYATVWAAQHLYGFIGGGLAAAMFAAIAWGLLGLAFLHGQALAVLALAGAYFGPLLTGTGAWSLDALSVYLGILVIAGVAVGWLRRWTGAAWTNIAGAAVWTMLAALQQDATKCLFIGIEPLAATAAIAYAVPRDPRRALGPGVVILASVAAFFALPIAAAHGRAPPIWVIAGLVVPFAAAALQQKGQVPRWSLAAPGVAFTMAAATQWGGHSLTLTWLWCFQILALNAAGLWAGWREEQRASTGVGASSSLALALVAGSGLGDRAIAPLGPAVACVAIGLGAFRLATDRSRSADLRVLNLWSGASAAALLAAIAVGFPLRWEAAGFAAATLGLAVIARRLGWRAIAVASSVAAGAGLGALLLPDVLTYALSGRDGAWLMLGVAALVAVASFVAARILARDRPVAEALRTLSPLAALTGAFIFLRWLAGGPGALRLDGLTEASIRTFLIADAGLVGLAQMDAETGRFARWRTHALMGAAAAHGLFFQALLYNPRFGFFGDEVGGAPLFNTLAAAYLAPAAVFAVAAGQTYRRDLRAGRFYCLVALFFFILWAFLEIRHLAHGPHLAGFVVGPGEAVARGVTLLAIAAIADRFRPRSASPAHPWRGDVGKSLTVMRVVAGGYAFLTAGLWSNPSWGVAAAPLGSWIGLAGVLGGYGVIILLVGRLALDARSAGKAVEADVGAVGAMAFTLILASLVVRAAFHGTDLILPGRPTSEIETWSYSAVWAVMGLALIGLSRIGGQLFLRAGLALLLITTAKVFVVDTDRLSGVVRAGSFLALGVLLVLGALTARRIAQNARGADTDAAGLTAER